MYKVYAKINENEYHYVGEFSNREAAIEFVSKQDTKCVVTEKRFFNEIIYENY